MSRICLALGLAVACGLLVFTWSTIRELEARGCTCEWSLPLHHGCVCGPKPT